MILLAINALIALYLLLPVIVVVATSVTTTAYPVFPPRGFTLLCRRLGLHLRVG